MIRKQKSLIKVIKFLKCVKYFHNCLPLLEVFNKLFENIKKTFVVIKIMWKDKTNMQKKG